MKYMVCAILSCVLTGLLPVRAQVRDYSAGFERLFQLGLPDVGDAVYVNLTVDDHQMRIHDHYWNRIKLAGNAWQLEPDKTDVVLFLFNEGRTGNIHERRHLARLRQEENTGRSPGFFMHQGDGRIGGTWRAASLADDLRKLQAHLDREEQEDPMQNHELHAIAGRVFIFAALAHRKGYTNEASALIDSLFEKSPDPREVILAGVHHLADQQYENAFSVWRTDRNWADYHERLDTLLGLFRSGWHKGVAVDRLNKQIALRLEQEEPPEVPGENLDGEDQELARQLSLAEEPVAHQNHGLWILPGTQQGHPWGAADTNHPLNRIKARSMKSLPLLIAMLDDDTMTDMSIDRISSSRVTYHTSHRERLDEQAIQRMYNSLSRPAARSDVAIALLKPLLAQEESHRHTEKSRDELRDEAEAWIARYQDADMPAIARDYLTEGNQEQQDKAARFLLHSGEEEHIQFVEAHLRENAVPGVHDELVLAYVQMRGGEGHEMAGAYLEQLRAAVDDEDHEQAWRASRMKRTIEQLEEIISGRTAKEYLAGLVSGQEEYDFQTLSRLLERETSKQGIEALLNAAVAAHDIELRGSLLLTLMNYGPMRHFRAQMHRMQAQMPEDDPVDSWVLDDFRPQWRQLLDDKREIAPGIGIASMSVHDRAVMAIEALMLQPEELMALYQVVGKSGKRIYPLLAERAEKRLAGGTDLPPLPSAESVSEERRAALQEELLESTGEELIGKLEALPVAEMLALEEMAASNKELGTHLVPVANRITQVQARIPAGEEVQEQYVKLDPQTLDRSLVNALLDILRADAKAGKSRVFSIIRQSALEGATMLYVDGSEPDLHRWFHPGTSGNSRIEGHIAGAPNMIHTTWPLETAAEDRPASEEDGWPLLDEMTASAHDRLDRNQDKEREDFWQGLQKLTTSPDSVFNYGFIVLRIVLEPDSQEGGE